MAYFHCSSARLGVGSIIMPGNWGRMLGLYTLANTNGLNINTYRESVLELSRKLYAPAKPSRLASVFTCPSQSEAVAFRDKHHVFDLIYEVMPEAEKFSTHVGDYELAFSPLPQPPTPYFSSIMDSAKSYWTIPATTSIEVLFDCPMKVIAGPL